MSTLHDCQTALRQFVSEWAPRNASGGDFTAQVEKLCAMHAHLAHADMTRAANAPILYSIQGGKR